MITFYQSAERLLFKVLENILLYRKTVHDIRNNCGVVLTRAMTFSMRMKHRK